MRSQLASKLRSLCTREGEGQGGWPRLGHVNYNGDNEKYNNNNDKNKGTSDIPEVSGIHTPLSQHPLQLPTICCPSFAACLGNCCKMCFVNLFKFMLKRSTKPDNNNNNKSNYITITSWQQQNRKLSNNNKNNNNYISW